jgi:hypothetical protein
MVHLLGVKPPTGQRKNALPQRRVPTPCGGGTRRAALAIRDMPLSVRVTTRSISFSAFIFGMVASFPIIGKRPVNATSLVRGFVLVAVTDLEAASHAIARYVTNPKLD